MGIVLGFLCILVLCFLLIKAITHKTRWKKADFLLMKVHKYLCAIFLVLCCSHIIFVIPVLKTRHPTVYITGIALVIVFLLILTVYHKMKNDHKIMLHWHRLFSILILICAIGHVVTYYIDFGSYQSKVKNIHLQAIDTTSLADGQYIGEYDVGYIYAKVSVTISNGQIEQIDILEHRNEKGAKAEKVIENITDTQDFPVDAISGATNSSKGIQGAIQDALKGGDIRE